MSVATHHELGLLLHGLAESLDISQTQYEKAVAHYEAVGAYLSAGDSPIVDYNPTMYPQGSFRLGTMIKPISDTDEFDIDLVCELKHLRKERTTQKQLKDMIGDRLKADERYRKMLEEGNRCWTLQYADSARFHMDILPAIPDHDTDNMARRVGAKLSATGILITDRQVREWQRSNPVGYAEWFKDRMRVQLLEQRLELAKSLRASVEEVPEYLVKTPLQRAIQVLKRHRDQMFKNDQDDKPISVIISTLAASAYENEPEVVDSLFSILRKMPDLIERDSQGNAIVANPVNPFENFADKWQTYPERERNFYKWHDQILQDLDGASRAKSINEMAERLKPRFGDRTVNEATTKAFGSGFATAGVAAQPRPNIIITEPSKPWRP